MQKLSEASRRFRAATIEPRLKKAKGVLHLGAHLGYEAVSYNALCKPVVWVEALPDIHKRLAEKIASFPSQRTLCALLDAEDDRERDFHVSNNWEGVSSSMFPFGPFGEGERSLWPELGLAMKDRLRLKTSRLDTLLSANGVEPGTHDYWVVDLQGAELLALKGAGAALDSCCTLSVEVSTEPVYEGGVLWDELSQWLLEKGFTPLWQPELPHDDVVFIRNNELDREVGGAFHSEAYLNHNACRLDHLASLDLDLDGRSVLEVGAGMGDLTPFFLSRGCTVLATEARAENLAVLRRRFAGEQKVIIRALDMEHPEPLGQRFDIVFCYGLLYHLKNPTAAITHLAHHCGDLLLLETCVSYGAHAAVNNLAEPAGNFSQALYGTGCRPTRRWVWDRLSEVMPHVYATRTQPAHEQFKLDWTFDQGALLNRSVFVASRTPLDSNRELLGLLPDRQVRFGGAAA